ncbi:hypothetical protein H1C71_023159 [Ictidomys tridecemlineatus]|nr:hypothetical protein H1C71_023159 [Ictidomys tridecemlineatus]KAG3270362.1 hypothetical protein H1C71_023159 [Ictidomys tridecemlineatus]KAG3270363.1 hypothetical protein H1C71_023159 [Ictidomys tridecemlineatus]
MSMRVCVCVCVCVCECVGPGGVCVWVLELCVCVSGVVNLCAACVVAAQNTGSHPPNPAGAVPPGPRPTKGSGAAGGKEPPSGGPCTGCLPCVRSIECQIYFKW